MSDVYKDENDLEMDELTEEYHFDTSWSFPSNYKISDYNGLHVMYGIMIGFAKTLSDHVYYTYTGKSGWIGMDCTEQAYEKFVELVKKEWTGIARKKALDYFVFNDESFS